MRRASSRVNGDDLAKGEVILGAVRNDGAASIYCAFGCVVCGAVLDGVAFFFFFFTFSFGAACPAGVPCSLGCWAFTSDAVNTVAGTARLAASPTRKSTLRREIACDWICSFIANLSAYPTPCG